MLGLDPSISETSELAARFSNQTENDVEFGET